MNNSKQKELRRNKIRRRIRATVQGTAERPRLNVYKSNKFTYLQLIDDAAGATLASAKAETGVEKAKEAGLELAKAAQDKGITTAVFDRSGYKYHGVVKAAADGAREGGLNF
ncbi:MAG: 50S ribosomal protein L18 [Bacteroidota bacterium]